MSVLGVGLDVVAVARIERLLERHGVRALERLLTGDERTACQHQGCSARHVATRVAAKEAAYKALSAAGGDAVVWWRDVEVVRDRAGRDALAFHGRAREVAAQRLVRDALLSVTDGDGYVAAVVILAR